MARNLDRVAGIAEARQGISVPINRKFIRFVDTGSVTWTLTDDPGNDEIEVAAAAASSGGAPTGSIMAYAGTSVPVGWLECDGAAYGRTGGDPSPQAALFAAIGTTWGPGNGSTTFNVPNLARRTMVGRGGTGTGTLGNAVGNVGGGETHTLTQSELANHGHGLSLTDPGHGHQLYGQPYQTIAGPSGFGWILVGGDFASSPGGYGPSTNVNASNGNTGIYGSVSNAGGNVPHNNMQPSAVVMWIIKT